MNIKLVPQERGYTISVSKAGDVLTVAGVELDFSVIPEGATLPASAAGCEYIVDEVTRVEGVLHVTLLMPYIATDDPLICFPQPIADPGDGRIALPTDTQEPKE